MNLVKGLSCYSQIWDLGSGSTVKILEEGEVRSGLCFKKVLMVQAGRVEF